MTPRLLLTWSLRDLRARWIQVLTIALVIGLGAGSFASFNSMTAWRLASNDASYEVTRMYDLRVDLSDGSYLERGRLTDIIRSIPSAQGVLAIEERLTIPTQLRLEAGNETVLVPGKMVGMDFSAPDGPSVTRVHITQGSTLGPEDAGEPRILLEHNFATAYELPAEGQALLAGGRPVTYVGHALAPEHFFVLTEEGAIFAHTTYAIIFSTVETVGMIAERPGTVNDAVMRLDDSLSRESVIAELERALAAALPRVGVVVTQDSDDPVFRAVTEDVAGDQQTTNVIAFAIFIGAVFAAFNLTSRMVETQRREIGVAMALGVPGWQIALRPMLVGAQIALSGIVFGVVVGWLLAQALKSVLNEFLPLPVWESPFQYGIFIIVNVVALLVLLVAIGYPIRRAVGVQPIDAIRTGHLAARGGGLAPLMTRLPIPGATFGQLPFRNVARAPRRAALTILGIAAAVAVIVVLVGIFDSYLSTLQAGREETLKSAEDRLIIDLALPVPTNSSIVTTIRDAESIAAVEPGLRVGASLSADDADEGFEVLLRFIDFDSAFWTPTAVEGQLDQSRRGIVVARKAASDLGVAAGDEVVLTHPVREGLASFSLRETRLPVLAIHPHYLRTVVYMDNRHADMLNIGGTTNRITALAVPDTETIDVKEELFTVSGVVSVTTVEAEASLTEDLLNQFISIMRVMQAIPLLLAVLIAYNTASIAMDERRREHATMAAYGVPYRTILRMAAVESLIMGVIATIVGVILGLALMLYLINVILPRTSPELGLTITFTPTSFVIVFVLGVLAVAAAPLLTARKLRRDDIPSTLRVME